MGFNYPSLSSFNFIHMAIEIPIWLWLPKNHPKFPVLEENYRCCGKRLPCIQTFRWINIIQPLIVAALFFALVTDLPFTGDDERTCRQMWLLGGNLLISVWAVLSTYQQKPFFSQIYFLVAAPYLGIGMVACLVFFFQIGLSVIIDNGIALSNVRKDSREALGIHLDYRYDWIVLLAVTAFGFLIFALQFLVTLAYCHFVRDRQIEIDGPISFTENQKSKTKSGEAREIPTWLWRPKEPKFPFPLCEENYQSCFKKMSCVTAFRWLHFLQPVTFALLFFQLVVRPLNETIPASVAQGNYPFQGTDRSQAQLIMLLINMLAPMWAIFSSYNPKPFFIQLYFLFAACYFPFAILLSGATFARLAVTLIKDSSDRSDDYFRNTLRSEYGIAMNDVSSLMITALFVAILCIWQLITTTTFWRYAVDRQLELEATMKATIGGGDHQLNDQQSNDTERSPLEIYSEPPPPLYSKIIADVSTS